MKINRFLAALPLALSLALSPAAGARTQHERAAPQTYQGAGEIVGREVAAPSWSDACMTDHGPTPCGEPMWVYGSPGAVARYRSAF